MLGAMNSRRFIRSPHALLADLATDDIAEQFPTFAFVPELKLLDSERIENEQHFVAFNLCPSETKHAHTDDGVRQEMP
jgi:hypothetical protein